MLAAEIVAEFDQLLHYHDFGVSMIASHLWAIRDGLPRSSQDVYTDVLIHGYEEYVHDIFGSSRGTTEAVTSPMGLWGPVLQMRPGEIVQRFEYAIWEAQFQYGVVFGVAGGISVNDALRRLHERLHADVVAHEPDDERESETTPERTLDAEYDTIERATGGRIVSREAWGAEPLDDGDRYNQSGMTHSGIVIHHTGDPKEAYEGGSMAGLQGSHMNNWIDVGYHFVIDANGRVYEGRPIGATGAHDRGRNDYVGIGLFGDFSPDPARSPGMNWDQRDDFETVDSLYENAGGTGDSHLGEYDVPTAAQLNALAWTISFVAGQYGIASIDPHWNNASKACPGLGIWERWEFLEAKL